MKTQSHRLRRLAFAVAASAFVAPAFAQDFGPHLPRPVVAEPVLVPAPIPPEADSGIHAGANNPADNQLAARVAEALADEPRLDGATVTVAANGGRVSISGSADSPEQGAIAEQVARRVDGVESVSGTLSSTGG